MQVQRSHILLSASVALGLLGTFFAVRELAGTPKRRRQVARKLPVAKKLGTIPDVSGNYDIDGVSFDTEGVIVSGDANKGLYI